MGAASRASGSPWGENIGRRDGTKGFPCGPGGRKQQGNGRSEGGQGDAGDLSPGRRDQPLTASSPRREEQRGRALGPAAGEPRWALGALVFVKRAAPLLLARWRLPAKAGQSRPGARSRGFRGAKSRLPFITTLFLSVRAAAMFLPLSPKSWGARKPSETQRGLSSAGQTRAAPAGLRFSPFLGFSAGPWADPPPDPRLTLFSGLTCSAQTPRASLYQQRPLHLQALHQPR